MKKEFRKQNQNERRIEMFHFNLKRWSRASLAVLILGSGLTGILSGGCSDSGVNESGHSSDKNIAAGNKISDSYKDTTLIKLDLGIRFKSTQIVNSCLLEGSNGSSFGHIVPFEKDLKPGDELDLQQLQPTGIYALYITSSKGKFTISNLDGMSVSTKSILFEKCEFIDLKVTNAGTEQIHVAGFVAGE